MSEEGNARPWPRYVALDIHKDLKIGSTIQIGKFDHGRFRNKAERVEELGWCKLNERVDQQRC